MGLILGPVQVEWVGGLRLALAFCPPQEALRPVVLVLLVGCAPSIAELLECTSAGGQAKAGRTNDRRRAAQGSCD